ncbi:hypothetical protein GE09DRAFT_315696 [Coniochaeta sp. 2T2.1]|nr:hypothetical protein GE09DRAFT_315696 [Coniochaeta sp. 2T2.1]
MTGRHLEPTPPASGSSLLRPLLPAESQSRGPELPQRHFEFKRKRQAAACEPCREHKTKVPTSCSPFFPSLLSQSFRWRRVGGGLVTKLTHHQCDGNRPSCNACLRRSTECRFEAEPKETHVQALKRKFDSLQGEASSLQQVYELLRTRPEAEALSIFHKIRDGESHESILQFVRHGDLLLQLSLTSSEASPRTGKFSSGDTVASSVQSEPLSPPFDRAPRGSISSATSTQGYTSTEPTQSASASRRPSTAPHTEQQMDCEVVEPLVNEKRHSQWAATVMADDR